VTSILLVLEIQRFKSVKACRPKARQAKVNANSSTNSIKSTNLFLLNTENTGNTEEVFIRIEILFNILIDFGYKIILQNFLLCELCVLGG
ncbi:MAG: hypothetical protein LBP59_13990, partial [Planctomycetaceae bacterium]|nr:hypothetical protein [Planctomycetaceae bacterium]